ncbi:hypothetical protein BI362_03030 [Streptococcus parauberis]|nr:hypothetical protein BI362_03030 [Streptococcus parauberis]QBX18260.1 hypothetical protein Javan407_0027 [Streptococcus phage Javan407]
MKIEEYELGQKVSLYGVIEEIDIENIHDKENTTTLSIKTVTGKIHVNPKWEEVKLDQPKPVVPQFVAEWYEEHKDKLEEELCYQIWLIRESGAETDFEYWLTETENPSQTLINMHQFGYTVQLYTVKIPNPNGCNLYLIKLDKEVTITLDLIADAFPDNLKLTEQEIRKDYDWAFRWAKEVTE